MNIIWNMIPFYVLFGHYKLSKNINNIGNLHRKCTCIHTDRRKGREQSSDGRIEAECGERFDANSIHEHFVSDNHSRTEREMHMFMYESIRVCMCFDANRVLEHHVSDKHSATER